MMTTKQYEFCDDIWSEIKSYLFVPRKRGDKCDSCDDKWTKVIGMRYWDCWWEGAKRALCLDGKNRDHQVPGSWGDYPHGISVGSSNEVELKHYCNVCWVQHVSSRIHNNFNEFRGLFKNKFDDTEKIRKIYYEVIDQFCAGEWNKHWLIKNHRIIATRKLQAEVLELIEKFIKDLNFSSNISFEDRVREMNGDLFRRRVSAYRRIWEPLMTERNNRKLLKDYADKKISYNKFVRLFRK